VRLPYKQLGCAFGVGGEGKRKSGDSQFGGESIMVGPFGLADLGEWRRLAGTTSRS
jgi:hypothetical protein